jgi:sporulation protein YunB
MKPIYFFIVAIIVGILVLFELKIRPVVAQMAAWQAQTIALNTVNRATDFALSHSNVVYSQLAVITRNEKGEVTSVQANMPQINAIAVSITENIIKDLEQLSYQEIKIPLGTLLDSHFFAGKGPELSFYVLPTESVEANIQNKFESTGINQTLHRIILKLDIGIMGVLPGYTNRSSIKTEICLAETVIIGAVPDYYTQIDGVEGDVSGLISDYGPGQIDVDIP